MFLEFLDEFFKDSVMAEILARSSCFFLEVRPTAKEILDVLLDEEEFKLPTPRDILKEVVMTNMYLHQNGYIPFLEEKLTVEYLLDLNYRNIIDRASSLRDSECLERLLNHPFVNYVNKEHIKQVLQYGVPYSVE